MQRSHSTKRPGDLFLLIRTMRITFAKDLVEANQNLIAAHTDPYRVATLNDDPWNPEFTSVMSHRAYPRKPRPPGSNSRSETHSVFIQMLIIHTQCFFFLTNVNS